MIMEPDNPSIAAQIALLGELPIAQLWEQWDRYFPHRPVKPSRTFLVSRIAYKLQETAYGGLSTATRKRLETIGAQHSKIQRRAPAQVHQFVPGTVLLREWGERTHQVTVTAEGRFEYEGNTYKSLTAVARAITGARWSGPLFFGLKK